MNSPETDLARRMRARYVEAGRQLDPATSRRLQLARQQAIDAMHSRSRGGHLLLPAGAFAVVALAAVLVWQPLQRPPASAGVSPANAQRVAQVDNSDRYLPPDADSDDARLYQDLDFYGWLASTDNGDSASSH